MKLARLKIYALFCFLGFLLWQCKEPAEVYPQVNITSPVAGQAFNFGDTLVCEFTAAPAERVRFFLLSSEGASVAKGFLINRVADSYTVGFYLNNPYLPAGNYELKVSADNGTLNRSDFKKIRYQELALAQQGFVALGGGNLYHIDSVGQVRSQTVNSAYRWVEVLAAEREIFLAGPTSTDLKILDLNTLGPKFSIAGPNPPGAPQFNQILNYNRAVYTLRADGFLNSYLGSNQVGISYDFGNAVPTQASPIGGQIAVTVRESEGSNRYQLQIFNPEFLGPAQSYFLSNARFKLTAIGPMASSVAIFKINNGFQLQTINLNSQAATTRLIENASEVFDCETLPNGDIIYSTPQGTFIYNLSMGARPNQVLNFAVQDLEVSQVNGAIYVLNNGIIQRLKADGTLVYTAAASTATNFTIVYNK
jgi:hypothetical protein